MSMQAVSILLKRNGISQIKCYGNLIKTSTFLSRNLGNESHSDRQHNVVKQWRAVSNNTIQCKDKKTPPPANKAPPPPPAPAPAPAKKPEPKKEAPPSCGYECPIRVYDDGDKKKPPPPPPPPAKKKCSNIPYREITLSEASKKIPQSKECQNLIARILLELYVQKSKDFPVAYKSQMKATGALLKNEKSSHKKDD